MIASSVLDVRGRMRYGMPAQAPRRKFAYLNSALVHLALQTDDLLLVLFLFVILCDMRAIAVESPHCRSILAQLDRVATTNMTTRSK